MAEYKTMDENIDKVVEPEDTSYGNDSITHPFNPNELEIETPPYTIGYLIDRLEHNEINMNSVFQREQNLWSEDKQSRLIESILLGLPLPAFYFDASKPQWDIIDGLQRCCSIDNFCVKKTLKLTGLEFLKEKNGKSYLEGKGFDDLERALQRSIITRFITVNLIKKADKKIRYILFKRLNTRYLELSNAEIRNAEFQGVAADTIKQLAHLPEFIDATGGRIPTKRMEDRDFVSRFVAFYLKDYTEYQPGLDEFVNSAMETLIESDKVKLENDFKSALKLAVDVFGNDAFRKRTDTDHGKRPLNKAYFEVITVTFSKLSEIEKEQVLANKDLLKENLITLMNSSMYSNSLSVDTGARDSVNIRFSWLKQVLNKSINGKTIRINDDNKIEDIEL
jgi:hypothetical protein